MEMSQNVYRVLLVDDEQVSYEFVLALLRSSREAEFAIKWVSLFDEAVNALLEGAYDVCLLDYNLGSFTGFELMAHVQMKGCRTPIVLLTGHGSHAIDMDALQAGAIEYLDKSQLKSVLLARTIRYAVKVQRDKNELEDVYAKVRELEQLKTDMIRIAAHDLRTPLMAMLNYAHFLQTDKENPLQAYQIGYANHISQGVYQMQNIISDILSLERIQETADESYEYVADLVTQVKQAIDTNALESRDLVYTIEIPDDPINVKGSAAQLREAAINMISNAMKYSPDGANVTVTLKQEGGFAVFTVVDTGYGIPMDMQARLFQPFYRAKTKETRHVSGTGLGLHLVKNIVTRHKGEIIFHSIQGEGSTFGFRIPMLD